MADRPILFSTPMVRALLAGTKTQTRRFLDAGTDEPIAYIECGAITALDEHEREYRWPRTHAVGDRLWVKETWRVPAQDDRLPPRDLARQIIGYEADCALGFISATGKVRVSIHMPRWASRLTLHVTDVRVQRLDEIDDADARAEGIQRGDDGWWGWSQHDAENVVAGNPTEAYMELWESINGAGSWAENPWVAAYTFTVERANIDQVEDRSMITEPSASSRQFLRKRDATSASLHRAVDRLPPRKRDAAIEAASQPSIRYERYRKNGITRIRRAKGG